ncbi:hypothetical protein L209DRAFT_148386 [Thermothelomyces heterothallicus CBS 203.75]
MRAFALSLGALAIGLASAHEYPNCEADGCYRNLIDERFAEKAVSFCPEFLAGTTTAASAIPTDFANCEGDVKAVSSACSCITYTATATATSSTTEVSETSTTEVPPESSTTEAPETSSTEAPETSSTETPETSTTKWTTSTITTTATRTITSCPPPVTKCPGNGTTTVTTETIVTTTVCPVTETTTTDTLSRLPSGPLVLLPLPPHAPSPRAPLR